MKIKELLQYRGNNNYFCCYCEDEENKNFIIFARTNGVNFNSEVEEEWSIQITPPLTNNYLQIPFYKHYYIMYVDDFKDYELINQILEVIWIGDSE